MCNGWGRCVLAQHKCLDEAVVRVKNICPGGARLPGNVPPRCRPTMWDQNRSVYQCGGVTATSRSAPVAFHKIFDGRIIGRRRFLPFEFWRISEYNIIPRNSPGPSSLILQTAHHFTQQTIITSVTT